MSHNFSSLKRVIHAGDSREHYRGEEGGYSKFRLWFK